MGKFIRNLDITHGTVECTHAATNFFTEGMLYALKEGELTCDDGSKIMPTGSKFKIVSTAPFAVGDNVRCIDNSCYSSFLTIGKIYTVLTFSGVRSTFVHIRDDTGSIKGCYASRFELEGASIDDIIQAEINAGNLPDVAAQRKATPVYSGVLNYFPDALQAVAQCSKAGNDQHNPGEPLHWARDKSGDELDALTRHLLDAGTIDTDGIRHSAKVAWRALANLQKELEAADE